MDKRPVGVFDSGIGGLTAVEHFRKILPEENIVYFGDTARCPYGTKTIEELKIIAADDLRFLASFDCKVILAACGTVSANCTDLIDSFPIKAFNVVDASVEEMSKYDGDGCLAVLATDATITSGTFQNRISAKNGKEVIGIACQDFVELCEKGHTDRNDPELKTAVEKYLSVLRERKCDRLLLGCTHFGHIKDAIAEYLPGTEIVEASECAARCVAEYLSKNGLTGGDGNTQIYTSGYGINA